MKTRKYSSYAQINTDLEILKLEREIHFKKIILNFDKTIACFNPNHIFKNILDSIKPVITNSYFQIFIKIIPLIYTWFIKRKRG
jgi:hypothetical protein